MGKKKIVEQKEEELLKEAESRGPSQSGVGAKKRTVRRVEAGRIYIKASYNNTVITVTDEKGNVLAWATSGAVGFSGPKKATPFASSKVVSAVAEKISKTGPADVDVFISGIGPGRDSAIRSLTNYGFNILSIRDVTPIPHNGPRPKKVRRM